MNFTFTDRAWKFAQQKHDGQKDDGGQDYFLAHVVQVFDILRKVTTNEDVLAAGLLHDTIEDTDTTYEELKETFNERVADLVMEVTHEGNKQDGYYFPRLKSQNAIMIKMADRLSNISRMEPWSEKRREQYLRKTKFWKSTSDEATVK